MAKVSVVGTGFVGATSAYALALEAVCSDLILVDIDQERMRAEAADISHAVALGSSVRVHSGDYSDIRDSSVVVIAAGVNQKPGESRLDLLGRNVAIFKSVVPQVVAAAPNAVIVVATNPVDIMTEVTRALHPQPERVLGTGTVLDTARFRDLLGREIGISPRYIHANVVGEHGDSSVLSWAAARAGGLPIPQLLASMGKTLSQETIDRIEKKVRGAAATIIAGKQATYYGIGAAVMKIVTMILSDSRAVMTLSCPTHYDVCFSLPAIVGHRGIMQVIEPELSDQEQEKLKNSAKILIETRAAIMTDGTLHN